MAEPWRAARRARARQRLVALLLAATAAVACGLYAYGQPLHLLQPEQPWDRARALPQGRGRARPAMALLHSGPPPPELTELQSGRPNAPLPSASPTAALLVNARTGNNSSGQGPTVAMQSGHGGLPNGQQPHGQVHAAGSQMGTLAALPAEAVPLPLPQPEQAIQPAAVRKQAAAMPTAHNYSLSTDESQAGAHTLQPLALRTRRKRYWVSRKVPRPKVPNAVLEENLRRGIPPPDDYEDLDVFVAGAQAIAARLVAGGQQGGRSDHLGAGERPAGALGTAQAVREPLLQALAGGAGCARAPGGGASCAQAVAAGSSSGGGSSSVLVVAVQAERSSGAGSAVRVRMQAAAGGAGGSGARLAMVQAVHNDGVRAISGSGGSRQLDA